MADVATYNGAAFVDAGAAAKMLGVSRRTIQLWAESGILPAGRKVGRRRLWRVADLLEAIDGGRHGPVSAKR